MCVDNPEDRCKFWSNHPNLKAQNTHTVHLLGLDMCILVTQSCLKILDQKALEIAFHHLYRGFCNLACGNML